LITSSKESELMGAIAVRAESPTPVRHGGPIARGILAAALWATTAVAQQSATGPRNADLTGTGLRQLDGRHLTLLTDLDARPAIDELPQVFDQAIAGWCEYFQVPIERAATWRVRGYLMQNEDRFRAAGVLPDDLPPFLHGYQRDDEFWIREQPSDYYRRHLMLHEGTHAFMHQLLRRSGPGWYFEGVAELLATHRWDARGLQLRILPDQKEDVPEWGRIKLIRRAVAQGQTLTLTEVMRLAGRDFQAVEGYAWSWAAAAFLDGHPNWQATYRGWIAEPPAADRARFSVNAWTQLQASSAPIEEAWQLFLHELDYGYDIAADQVQYAPLDGAVDRAADGSRRVQVDAHRGWQSTGIELVAGQSYRLSAQGRYQLSGEPQPWPCEAGGVTLRYHGGWPAGILLAAVRPNSPAGPVTTPLAHPQPVGLAAVLRPAVTGTLFLRINEPAGLRRDNQGHLTVTVRAEPNPDRRTPD
jgi:hypothetical protein